MARSDRYTEPDGAPVRGATEVAAGDRQAFDRLFAATYEELRRLASTIQRSDPSATLTPTELVNEAWIKLAKSPHLGGASRLHFKRVAARAMRQVLIEAARRRKAHKRGSAPAVVTFDDSLPSSATGDTTAGELLALDAALEELARLEPRQAMMVECRFFGGFDVTETATLLEVSEATVLRDWRAAKAWLARELQPAR